MFHRRFRYGTATVRPYDRRPGNAARPAACRPGAWVEWTDGPPDDPHMRDARLARLEAVLLIADEPLPARRLAEVVGLADAAVARDLVTRLARLYDADGTAFEVVEVAGGYQLLTRPEYHPWLTRLRRTGHDLRLSPTALETLAVIAYKQPVMRAEVESIRGVSCGEVIRQLMEKGLVRVVGRHDSLGRPQLYGTTQRFLQAFGLNTLDDLPQVTALRNPGP